jgi:hypothetical protein
MAYEHGERPDIDVELKAFGIGVVVPMGEVVVQLKQVVRSDISGDGDEKDGVVAVVSHLSPKDARAIAADLVAGAAAAESQRDADEPAAAPGS